MELNLRVENKYFEGKKKHLKVDNKMLYLSYNTLLFTVMTIIVSSSKLAYYMRDSIIPLWYYTYLMHV